MQPKYNTMKKLVRRCHGSQKRSGGSPYWEHPYAVADMVESWGGTDLAVNAALSHDIIEDCNRSVVDIWEDSVTREFPEDFVHILRLVGYLSVRVPKDSTREYKHTVMISQLKSGFTEYPEIVMIKSADRIHNLRHMYLRSPEFQLNYLIESVSLYKTIVDMKQSTERHGGKLPPSMSEWGNFLDEFSNEIYSLVKF